MAATKPIPVRLENTLIDRLDAVANAMGTNRAAVMRLCVDAFTTAFEKHGKVILPLEFKDVLASLDNRTKESAAAKQETGKETKPHNKGRPRKKTDTDQGTEGANETKEK